MRNSDWLSDVRSSDLLIGQSIEHGAQQRRAESKTQQVLEQQGRLRHSAHLIAPHQLIDTAFQRATHVADGAHDLYTRIRNRWTRRDRKGVCRERVGLYV